MSEIAEAAEEIRKLDPGTPVRLPAVSRAVGWSSGVQAYAIQTGAVEVLPGKPSGRRSYMITREEALRILAAALLAVAAGIAVVTMVRGVRTAGLDVGRLIET
jgi:hypothetical protein